MTIPAYRDPDRPPTEGERLIRKLVLHQIEAHPETFHMGYWDTGMFLEEPPPCTTTRCVAGWALYFARCPVTPDEEPLDIEARATAVLGLSTGERYSAQDGDLFYDTDAGALRRMRELAEAGICVFEPPGDTEGVVRGPEERIVES